MKDPIESEKPGAPDTKPNLVIVASPRARDEPGSPLLRLARHHSNILKSYAIHTTRKTGYLIYGTGIYARDEVIPHRSGRDGGVAELAAMVACGNCAAVILLLDPGDPLSDAVENRALKRVSIQRQVRLITTYAAAVRWAAYEAPLNFTSSANTNASSAEWKPGNWRAGNKNITNRGNFKQLPIDERSIALISHDGKKLEMVKFVNTNRHLGVLGRHDRILTTGTTGWLLKLLFASELPRDDFTKAVRNARKEGRLNRICHDLLEKLEILPNKGANLDELLDSLRRHLKVSANEDFAEKVMPLPSGPDGGDVLIANEVLNNECHSIIFFHDPMFAHPHNDDIRLLEHTSALPSVFAECVSDRQSAEKWVEGLQKEFGGQGDAPSITHKLRQEWSLQEVILVETNDDRDSDELGHTLARACAGYLNQRLQQLSNERKEIRIGVAWGWASRHVLNQLIEMYQEGLLEKPASFVEQLVWSPLIGIITAEITHWEASMIAQGFCSFYGGRVEAFPCAGFARDGTTKPEQVTRLIANLEEAAIILTSASPWDTESTLYKNTGLNHEHFPALSEAVGLVSGVFLNGSGGEVKGQYSIVGLGYEGFRHAAENGAVILVCGGISRREVLLASLRKRLTSVLVTTVKTAEWILQQPEDSIGRQGPGS